MSDYNVVLLSTTFVNINYSIGIYIYIVIRVFILNNPDVIQINMS